MHLECSRGATIASNWVHRLEESAPGGPLEVAKDALLYGRCAAKVGSGTLSVMICNEFFLLATGVHNLKRPRQRPEVA
jgi:hypothetical protein